MTAMAEWTWEDVQRDEFAESLRVPLVTSPYPSWRYITAVVVSDLWRGVRPSDDELRVVASFHEEYCSRWYRGGQRQKMAECPFDLDGAANGRFLVKRANGGWGFRQVSWRVGPLFSPAFDAEPWDLVRVLDHQMSLGADRWGAWKADHAEVFAAVTS